MAPPCINYMEGGAIMTHPCINMSHIISTRESYPQYPWVISSVPMSHILSTHESYPQYPWVISSVPMMVCSTREDWGYAVPVSHILSTHDCLQYLWRYAVPVREILFILHSYKFTHRYCIFSWVLRIWLLSFLYVKLTCLKMTEKWPQGQAVVSYMYVS